MIKDTHLNSFLKIALALCFTVLIGFHLIYNQIVLLNSTINHTSISYLRFPHNSSTCSTADCYYWNPSILVTNGTKYVAVRESSRGFCGGASSISSVVNMITRPAISSCLIGTIEGNGEFSVMGHIQGDIPNMGKYHFGHEDPRWIIEQDSLYLLTTVEVSSVPRLFLTRVNSLQPNLTMGSPQRLYNPEKVTPNEMKNWMHIPMRLTDKPQERVKHLLFAYSLDPLLLIWVDPETGHSEPFYKHEEHVHEIRQRGSSAFIPTAAKDDEILAFIGLGHNQGGLKQLGLATYNTVVIRLVQNKDGDWKIYKSHTFSFPTASRHYAHRIQFATTITESNESILISLGDMDCTSHVVEYEKSEFLQWLDQSLNYESNIYEN